MPSTLATWLAVTSRTPYCRIMFRHSSTLREPKPKLSAIQSFHDYTIQYISLYQWLHIRMVDDESTINTAKCQSRKSIYNTFATLLSTFWFGLNITTDFDPTTILHPLQPSHSRDGDLFFNGHTGLKVPCISSPPINKHD